MDCWGNRSLIPVYRFYNEATQNYFHSTEFNPPNESIEHYDYAGIGFYSSPSLNHCGASVALHRYWVQTHYAYSTDNATDEKLIVDAGGEYKGIVAYIWPIEKSESKNNEISSQTDNDNIVATSADAATTTRTTDHTTSADEAREAVTTSYNTSDDVATEAITTTEYALENTQGVEPQTAKDCPVNSGNFR